MPQPKQQSPVTPEEFLEFLKMIEDQIKEAFESGRGPARAPAQQQGGGGGGGMSMNLGSLFGGGESAAGGGAGGGEAAGGGAGGGMGLATMGYIAAAILGQHLASKATDTEFEGQETGDAFSGSFGTEPWLALLHDKLGLSPTAGERFDAAVKNKDYGTAAKRLPAAADYWADPIRTWLGDVGGYAGKTIGGKKGEKVGSAVLNPIGALLGLFGK